MAERAPQASESVTAATAEAEPPKRPSEDEEIARHEQELLSEFDEAQVNGDASVALDAQLVGPDAQGAAPESEGESESTEQEPSEAKADAESEGEAEQPEAEAEAGPLATITVEESDRVRRQALDNQRLNLDKGYEQRAEDIRAQARRDLASEADAAKVAGLPDGERGRLAREQDARERAKTDLRPEVQADVLATLNREMGPQLHLSVGLAADPNEWPEGTRVAWNERTASSESFNFMDQLAFLHEDALARARTEWDAGAKVALDKALADQKKAFDASLAESNGAVERGATTEPRLVGEGGVAIGHEELEAAYAAGTATPAQVTAYKVWYEAQQSA
jgi:hypothetical protein